MLTQLRQASRSYPWMRSRMGKRVKPCHKKGLVPQPAHHLKSVASRRLPHVVISAQEKHLLLNVLHALVRSGGLVLLSGASDCGGLKLEAALEEELAKDAQGLLGSGNNGRAPVSTSPDNVTRLRAGVLETHFLSATTFMPSSTCWVTLVLR